MECPRGSLRECVGIGLKEWRRHPWADGRSRVRRRESSNVSRLVVRALERQAGESFGLIYIVLSWLQLALLDCHTKILDNEFSS